MGLNWDIPLPALLLGGEEKALECLMEWEPPGAISASPERRLPLMGRGELQGGAKADGVGANCDFFFSILFSFS